MPPPELIHLVEQFERNLDDSLVRRMLDLHKELPKAKTPHAKELIDRDIAATDRRVDELVYQLYGLTEKEMDVVEGSSTKG